MKRKIIQLSSNTNVVSLPSEWTKRYALAKGDELDVQEVEGRLVLSTEKSLENSSISVNLGNTMPMTTRILAALFKSGYDEIYIDYAFDDERKLIEDVIDRNFIGFEIVKQKENRIVARKVSEENIVEFDNVLRRIFYLIKFIGNEAMDADRKTMKELISKDIEINKLADFCRRMLNKKGYSKFKRTPALYYVVEELEKIADEYRDLLKYVLENDINLDRESFDKTNQFFDMVYDCFYAFELKKIADIGRTRQLLKEEFLEQIRQNLGKDRHRAAVYIFFRNIVEKSFDLNGAIMAVSL